MAVEARIRELGSRHESLEEAIQEEMRRPAYDDMKLKELKVLIAVRSRKLSGKG